MSMKKKNSHYINNEGSRRRFCWDKAETEIGTFCLFGKKHRVESKSLFVYRNGELRYKLSRDDYHKFIIYGISSWENGEWRHLRIWTGWEIDIWKRYLKSTDEIRTGEHHVA